MDVSRRTLRAAKAAYGRDSLVRVRVTLRCAQQIGLAQSRRDLRASRAMGGRANLLQVRSYGSYRS